MSTLVRIEISLVYTENLLEKLNMYSEPKNWLLYVIFYLVWFVFVHFKLKKKGEKKL